MPSEKLRNLLCAIVAVLGFVFVAGFVFGGEKADRLSITTLQEKRVLTVAVTLKDVTERYRWLSVYACSAAVLESGTFCTGDFERESTFEVYADRSQYLVDWRDLPGGTLQITAMAFDVDDTVLAQSRVTVFRGR